MMRLKLQSSLIILFIVGLGLYSCVDEPTIAPVKRPYTVLQVSNFSHNVDVINVTIGGQPISNIAKLSFNSGGYFDIMTGQKEVVATDGNNNELYRKFLSFGSYEIQNLVFFGTNSNVDTLNSFGTGILSEGVIYTGDSAPLAGTARLKFANFAADGPDSLSRAFSFIASNADTSFEAADVLFSETGGTDLPGGDYSVRVYFQSANNTRLDSSDHAITLTNGMRHYLLVSGEPMNYTVTINESEPLPARSK